VGVEDGGIGSVCERVHFSLSEAKRARERDAGEVLGWKKE